MIRSREAGKRTALDLITYFFSYRLINLLSVWWTAISLVSFLSTRNHALTNIGRKRTIFIQTLTSYVMIIKLLTRANVRRCCWCWTVSPFRTMVSTLWYPWETWELKNSRIGNRISTITWKLPESNHPRSSVCCSCMFESLFDLIPNELCDMRSFNLSIRIQIWTV